MANGTATYTTLDVPRTAPEPPTRQGSLLLAGSGPTATEITDALDPMGIMTLRVDTPGDDPACACGPRPGPPRPTLPPTGPPHRPTVAVITSMTAGPDQTPPCQVDIRLGPSHGARGVVQAGHRQRSRCPPAERRGLRLARHHRGYRPVRPGHPTHSAGHDPTTGLVVPCATGLTQPCRTEIDTARLDQLRAPSRHPRRSHGTDCPCVTSIVVHMWINLWALRSPW